jgi:hypothetical protein
MSDEPYNNGGDAQRRPKNSTFSRLCGALSFANAFRRSPDDCRGFIFQCRGRRSSKCAGEAVHSWWLDSTPAAIGPDRFSVCHHNDYVTRHGKRFRVRSSVANQQCFETIPKRPQQPLLQLFTQIPGRANEIRKLGTKERAKSEQF